MEKKYGGTKSDYATSVHQTTDGGYIVAGFASSKNGDVTGSHGGMDYWILKLNSDGSIHWKNAYGGSGDESANSIQQTTDGGYIVAGYATSNDGDVSGNHGGRDAWIVKLNAAGNIQWQKAYGGSGSDEANSIQQTVDGGYIVAGTSNSNDGDVSGNHGSADDWIIKLDDGGNIQWQKTYGGSAGEGANSIQQTTDGGYIVAGFTFSNDGDVTGFHGVIDYWVLKLNAKGKIQWERAYGGTNYDYGTAILQAKGGGYIMAGHSGSNDGDVTGHHAGMATYTDYWVVKLYADGNINWQRSLGGSYDDQAYQVLQTTDGNFVIAGWAMSSDGDITVNHGLSDFWILSLNKRGELNWQKTYGQKRFDYGSSIQQTNDGGYIVAGHAGNTEEYKRIDNKYSQASDYMIIKLSPEILTTAPELITDNLIAMSISSTQLSTSPNPAKKSFKIVFSSTSKNKVNAILYDVNGKATWNSGLINANTLNGKQVNASQFAKRVFYLKIINEQGELIGSTKIIIAN